MIKSVNIFSHLPLCETVQTTEYEVHVTVRDMGTTGVHLLTHTSLLSRWISPCHCQNYLSLLEIKK